MMINVSSAISDTIEDGVKYFSANTCDRANQAWIPLARQQNSQDQLYIGVLNHYGPGVESGQSVAAQWYEKAANGLADAQYEIGLIYEPGRGVEQNYRTAESWYRKAVAQVNRVQQGG